MKMIKLKMAMVVLLMAALWSHADDASIKIRLSESAIPRPLRKFDLADHHGLDPVTTPHFSGGQSLVPTIPTTSSREVVKGAERCFTNLGLRACPK